MVGAVRLPGGAIVVANRGTHDLRYYTSRGEHLATAGGAGNGPGEFRWLDWIGVAGDSVLAWDAFARRVSVFDAQGRFVRSVHLRELEIPFPQAEGVTGRNIVLRPRPAPDAAPPGAGEYTDSVTYRRFSLDSGEQTGLLGPHLDAERYVTRVGRLDMSAPVIFGREGRVAVHPEGIVTAVSDGSEIIVHDPSGRRVRRLRPAHRPARAGRADVAERRAQVERERADVVRAFPQMRPVLARLVEQLPHRPNLPAISAMEVARDGTLWVRDYVPPSATSARWSVFDRNGRWLAVVAVPAEIHVLEIGIDSLLARVVDGDGVERVAVHRIVR